MMHMEVVVLHIGHSPKDVSDGTNAGDGAGQLINGEAVHKSVLGEEVEHDYFLLGKQGQKDFFGDVFVEDQFVLAGFWDSRTRLPGCLNAGSGQRYKGYL